MTDHRFDSLDPVARCPQCGTMSVEHGVLSPKPFPAPAEGPRIVSAKVDGWGTLFRLVKLRDRACVFSPVGIALRGGRPLPGVPDHFCQDRDRRPILWHRANILTADVELDHVKEEPMMGAKAPDDEAHLATVCYLAHHGGLATSAEGRDYERRWLASFYPAVWSTYLARQEDAAHA